MTARAAGSIRPLGITRSAKGCPVVGLEARSRCRGSRRCALLLWERSLVHHRRSTCCSSLHSSHRRTSCCRRGACRCFRLPLLVRVGKGIAALDARERLVVRQGVQAVAAEVVEARAAVSAEAALGRHHNARQAPVLGAVGVREHRDLGDGVKARRRVADGAEDGVGRRLSVLDVRHAVGLGAQELDVIGAADHVRVEQQEGLDVPAVARQVDGAAARRGRERWPGSRA